MLLGTGYLTGKKPARGASMGNNLYPRAGMDSLWVELELAGAGMEWYYPMSFYLPRRPSSSLISNSFGL
jgi:hypothetical protein